MWRCHCRARAVASQHHHIPEKHSWMHQSTPHGPQCHQTSWNQHELHATAFGHLMGEHLIPHTDPYSPAQLLKLLPDASIQHSPASKLQGPEHTSVQHNLGDSYCSSSRELLWHHHSLLHRHHCRELGLSRSSDPLETIGCDDGNLILQSPQEIQPTSATPGCLK